MNSPDMKNQVLTPVCSAIGLLTRSPTGVVTDEIRVSMENALPIFFSSTVS